MLFIGLVEIVSQQTVNPVLIGCLVKLGVCKNLKNVCVIFIGYQE